jgi:ankyrin repeat protein
MLIAAARAGDLESLTVWAEQGVQVTTARPLCVAVGGRYLEVVRLLVWELGADVNQASHGLTPLLLAAKRNNLTMVQCLVDELGADVNQAMPNDGRTALDIAARNGYSAVVRCLVHFGAEYGAIDTDGDTALLESARDGRYGMMQYLLEEAGAKMEDANNFGNMVWDMLRRHLKEAVEYYEQEAELAMLPGLLRVLVLRGAPPHRLLALLSPESARVVQEGARLRARLPAYLAHRRAYLDSRCPRISLLPGVLRALIYTFEGPATTKELWATGLGTSP